MSQRSIYLFYLLFKEGNPLNLKEYFKLKSALSLNCLLKSQCFEIFEVAVLSPLVVKPDSDQVYALPPVTHCGTNPDAC